MTIMAARQLAIQKIYLGANPVNGPKILPFSLEFDAVPSALGVDALTAKLSNIFGTPQAIFVDNHLWNGVLTLEQHSWLSIYVPAFSWGVYPLFLGEKLRLSASHTVANAIVPIALLNTAPPSYFSIPVL